MDYLNGVRKAGKFARPDHSEQFEATRLQLASLKATATGDDKAAAEEANKELRLFVDLIAENGLLDYLISLRKENPPDS